MQALPTVPHAGGTKVRIPFAPARSLRTIGPSAAGTGARRSGPQDHCHEFGTGIYCGPSTELNRAIRKFIRPIGEACADPRQQPRQAMREARAAAPHPNLLGRHPQTSAARSIERAELSSQRNIGTVPKVSRASSRARPGSSCRPIPSACSTRAAQPTEGHPVRRLLRRCAGRDVPHRQQRRTVLST
jgi:hypothetical protein